MGQIIHAKASEIIPCQAIVSMSRLCSLLPFFREGKQAKLFPSVICHVSLGDLVLNGHHRLVLADLFDVSLDIYRMDGPDDLIREASHPLLNRYYFAETNGVIAQNYRNAERWAQEMHSCGYHSIHDLRLKNDITLRKLEEYF